MAGWCRSVACRGGANGGRDSLRSRWSRACRVAGALVVARGAGGRAPRGLRGRRTWWSGCWPARAPSVAAAVRAARRARCYGIGADIDDDAFASSPLPLVRRTPAGYVMRLTPGMTGQLEAGRAPIPLESVIGEGVVDMPLPADSRAEVRVGLATFVVRSGPDSGPAPELPGGRRCGGSRARRCCRSRSRRWPASCAPCARARRSATPT